MLQPETWGGGGVPHGIRVRDENGVCLCNDNVTHVWGSWSADLITGHVGEEELHEVSLDVLQGCRQL